MMCLLRRQQARRSDLDSELHRGLVTTPAAADAGWRRAQQVVCLVDHNVLAAAQGLEGGCEFGTLVAVEVGHALGAVQRDHHRPPHRWEVHLRALEQVRQAAKERSTAS